MCVTNKVLTRNFVINNFVPKSIMLGRTEQHLKLKVFEHESNLCDSGLRRDEDAHSSTTDPTRFAVLGMAEVLARGPSCPSKEFGTPE